MLSLSEIGLVFLLQFLETKVVQNAVVLAVEVDLISLGLELLIDPLVVFLLLDEVGDVSDILLEVLDALLEPLFDVVDSFLVGEWHKLFDRILNSSGCRLQRLLDLI